MSNLAWGLLDAGASDVISWDSCDDPIQAIITRLERWREVDELIASEAVQDTLVGTSPCWLALLRRIVEVARFTRSSVLITGESGTGKELVARLIHQLDDRPGKRDLTILDCTTVVPSLSGSEFFGHEKGAFTGAASARDGAFALANGGTLFLDEVGELPPNLQAELLRVIQEGMYKRVGGNTWHTTDFRLISATNRDLTQDQKAGRFRLDLYYRIAAWPFRLPSLDERREDIEPLARYFLWRSGPNGSASDFEPAVRAFLLAREYPGNVRDLRQLVERMSQRHVGNGPVTVGDVPDDDRPDGFAGFPAGGPAEDGLAGTAGSPGNAGGAGGSGGAGEDGSAGNGTGRPAGLAPWYAGAFGDSVRQAVARGVSLKEITQVAAETAVSAALADSDGSVARAARTLSVTARALQLRRAAGRLTVPPAPRVAADPPGNPVAG